MRRRFFIRASGRRGDIGIFSTALGAGVTVAVFLFALPTWLGGWAPVAHSTCQDQALSATELMFLPGVLVNSPFGGTANGLNLMPASFPGGLGYPNTTSGIGTGSANGSAVGMFFLVDMGLFRQSNATVFGPGSNTRCASKWAAQALPTSKAFTPYPIQVLSNLTDVGEASSVGLTGYSGHPLTPLWNNSFSAANGPSLSTCGGPSETETMQSRGFEVEIPFSWSGAELEIPFLLPFGETFHYTFPANFGIWQIDNLSEPGGPGGGWAFSYSPCP